MSRPMMGRDAIALIKRTFGINQDRVTRIALVADLNDVLRLDVECIGAEGGRLVSVATSGEHESIRRFEVTVQEVED